MEFPLVDDPNILTQHTSDQTVAQFEYASFNSARNTLSIGCEIASDQTQLSYDVYVLHFFVPERNRFTKVVESEQCNFFPNDCRVQIHSTD